jgi:archaemetzincin
MKIGVLSIGQVGEAILLEICKGLMRSFPHTACVKIDVKFPLRQEAFDEKRKQYRSHIILREIQSLAVKNPSLDRVLGVVDADIFVPKLNFVFGEAVCPGKGALISLWRLRPEFYGGASNRKLFLERAVKEAVHEVGHTLGLRHCLRALCVMHFSNSISCTDIKQGVFCERCYLHAEIGINRLR